MESGALKSLIARLDRLGLQVRQDQAKQNWGTYDGLVQEYHRIRKRLIDGFPETFSEENVEQIRTVPPQSRGGGGSVGSRRMGIISAPPITGRGTQAEKAKYSELALATPSLLDRLNDLREAFAKSEEVNSQPGLCPTIGIVTALPKEYAAVSLLLEKTVEDGAGSGAGRRFLVGQIPSVHGGHHVVALTLLSDMGNNSAAISATKMLSHFQSVRHVIMCGIAGGIPCPGDSERDVRLGDIVVSDRNGVVQYDLVKENPDGSTEGRSPPRAPGAELLEAAKHLEVGKVLGQRPWESHLAVGQNMEDGERPPDDHDAMGESIEYPSDSKRTTGQPRTFFGTIASANRLLKNPAHRDYLSKAFGVKAVEMEGSGIADAAWDDGRAGYLVVRGVCDYCDEHKGDVWQGAAAVAAAAYTRALVGALRVDETQSAS